MKRHSIALFALIACLTCCLVGAASPKTKCARCGAEAPCEKMCRLVCEEKKVEVVCWGCKCEDFCVPGPGCPTCEHCDVVCQTCGEGAAPSQVCSKPKRFFWYDWDPSFVQMYTKTKLMRRTETVKVPTYKWVIEDLCCNCARGCASCNCGATDAGPAAESTKK
jgi:hypothetical protein